MILKNPNTPNAPQYVGAVTVVVGFVLLGAVIVVVARPDSDIVVVLTLSFGFATSMAGTVISAMKSQEASLQAQAANEQAKETHLIVNSRMEQAIKDAAKAAYGEGVKAGREDANKRTDMLKREDKK